MFRQIIRQIFALPPLIQETISLEPEAIKRMTGTYTLGKMFELTVEHTDGAIMLRPYNIELKPLNETTCCFAHDHEMEVHFSDLEEQVFRSMTLQLQFSSLDVTRAMGG